MSRSKKHHYTPRGYLKHFASNKGYVRVYDRLSQQFRKQHIREVAAENNLYSIRDIDQNPSDAFEQGPLARLDDEISQVLSRLLMPRPSLSARDRHVVEMFLAVQVARTPAARRFLSDSYDLFLRMEVEMNVGGEAPDVVERFIAERYADVPEFEKERIRGIAADPSKPVDLTTEEWIETFVGNLPRLISELKTRAWTFVEAPAGKAFLTGDLPVVLAGLQQSVGLGNAVFISWPLSPKRVLYLGPQGSDDDAFQIVPADPTNADLMNQMLADRVPRQLYWHPDHDPVASINLPRGPLYSGVNGIPVAPGESSYDKIRQDWLPLRDQLRAERAKKSTSN